MKAVIISEAGATPKVLDDIEIPDPSEGELLVKVLYTAVNPVDASMATTGGFVTAWPFTPGCDVSGVVVKTGPNAINALGEPFQEGDKVFGCTRVGVQGYTAWGEYLLMDAPVTIPKPDNISLAHASASGVGILTASLGVFDGLEVPLLNPSALPGPRDEWALVFGGAGSVGQFAVQLLKVTGFKVVTTCSTKSFDLLRSIGADVTVDYKKSEQEIVGEIERVTGGQLSHAFDAVSVNNKLLMSIYAALPTTLEGKKRLYTTTNTWEPLPTPTSTNPFDTLPIQLGPIGRPEAVELNKRLNEFIPVLHKLLQNGKVKTSDYTVEGEGIEGIIGAWDVQKSGVKGSTKVIVKVADE